MDGRLEAEMETENARWRLSGERKRERKRERGGGGSIPKGEAEGRMFTQEPVSFDRCEREQVPNHESKNNLSRARKQASALFGPHG